MARDLTYYLRLIGSWHSYRPRFVATVATLVQPLLDAQAMLRQLTEDFDIDSAIGVQLDVVGQWVGRSRFVSMPLEGVYFSFDVDGLGWDEGVWMGRYDPTEGLVELPDETYRTLLKLKVLANRWDSTVGGIIDDLDLVFPGVVVRDRQDMTMYVGIPAPSIDKLMLAVLTGGYIPIKPSAVRLDLYETAAVPEVMFGFDLDIERVKGFDLGHWTGGARRL